MRNTTKTIILFCLALTMTVFITSCGQKDDSGQPDNDSANTEMNADETTEAVTGETEEDGGQVEENIGEKFDARLIEAIANAEKGGVNPPFAVDIVLNTNMSDAIVSQLEAKNVDVVYGDKNKVRVIAGPKVLKSIKDLKYINNFVLITENYYPNK